MDKDILISVKRCQLPGIDENRHLVKTRVCGLINAANPENGMYRIPLPVGKGKLDLVPEPVIKGMTGYGISRFFILLPGQFLFQRFPEITRRTEPGVFHGFKFIQDRGRHFFLS